MQVPNDPLVYNSILYGIGLGGVLIHWAKKRLEAGENTRKELKAYLTTHMLESLIMFASYNAMFFGSLLIADFAKMNVIEVLTYGYSADSLSSLITKQGS